MSIVNSCESCPVGYVVPSPRSIDAIGGALRRVYQQAPSLPDELASVIARLDRNAAT